MKKFLVCLWSLMIFSLVSAPAQQKESAAEQEKHTEEKHTKPILDALKLDNAGKEVKVKEMVMAHLKALDAWHTENDKEIKALWTEFNKARSTQNETNWDAALAKIDGVYGSFKPEHEKFLSELSTVLTPEQVETVKDVMTVNKVEVTFHAYGEIFHGLSAENNAFILKNLKAAREEAIDAGTMTEKSAFFKKYKIGIEAHLNAHGFDVKQSYKDFVAKQKAEQGEKAAGKK
jgi:hypothetical protein